MVKLKTTSSLNMRKTASSNGDKIQVIPKGKVVKWYGYSFCGGSVEWRLVEYNGKLGFCSAKYLKEV